MLMFSLSPLLKRRSKVVVMFLKDHIIRVTGVIVEESNKATSNTRDEDVGVWRGKKAESVLSGVNRASEDHPGECLLCKVTRGFTVEERVNRILSVTRATAAFVSYVGSKLAGVAHEGTVAGVNLEGRAVKVHIRG